MAKTIRVCVLRGTLEPWVPHVGACRVRSREHGHCGLESAAALVAEGCAEWVKEEYVTRRGKEGERVVAAIRLVKRRVWRKRLSRDGRGTMAVMQLVA